ncbi:MAG: glycosyltransferase family 2 protein [Hydrogenophilaceae bacterium]|nr:glycosyltransferase family 2 protein [Hydrogenophilaceae bacterium]
MHRENQTESPSPLSVCDSVPVNLSLVVPVYNEAESIDLFVDRIRQLFEEEKAVSLEVVFVNDGSNDNTLDILLACQKAHLFVKIVDLSRNFGKEAALTAGLHFAEGEVVVPIDVDLQDPPELVLDMLAKWREGYEVVLARRSNRESDTWAKRTSANLFYRIHNSISDTKLPENVGDFRLMDRKVVNALLELPEAHRFMKGLFAWVGFRTCHVDYVRSPRVAGATKFNGWKLWNFAMEGVTSFSTYLLRIWTYLGALISFVAFLFAIFIIMRVFIQGVDVPGYASLMVAVTFFGGLQLIGIGILGEYLGRTYIESKRRPPFVVRQVYKTKE